MSSLTPEQKKTCCEFMKDAGWGVFKNGAYYRIGKEDKKFTDYLLINFDLNDAGLCVKELVNRDEWEDFYLYFIDLKLDHMENRIADLMSTESGEAVNFFRALAKWIEEGV
jgi:hypothetical protein